MKKISLVPKLYHFIRLTPHLQLIALLALVLTVLASNSDSSDANVRFKDYLPANHGKNVEDDSFIFDEDEEGLSPEFKAIMDVPEADEAHAYAQSADRKVNVVHSDLKLHSGLEVVHEAEADGHILHIRGRKSAQTLEEQVGDFDSDSDSDLAPEENGVKLRASDYQTEESASALRMTKVLFKKKKIKVNTLLATPSGLFKVQKIVADDVLPYVELECQLAPLEEAFDTAAFKATSTEMVMDTATDWNGNQVQLREDADINELKQEAQKLRNAVVSDVLHHARTHMLDSALKDMDSISGSMEDSERERYQTRMADARATINDGLKRIEKALTTDLNYHTDVDSEADTDFESAGADADVENIDDEDDMDDADMDPETIDDDELDSDFDFETGFFRSVGRTFTRAGRSVGKGFTDAGGAIADAATSVADGVTSVANKTWEAIEKLGSEIVKFIKSLVNINWDLNKAIMTLGKEFTNIDIVNKTFTKKTANSNLVINILLRIVKVGFSLVPGITFKGSIKAFKFSFLKATVWAKFSFWFDILFQISMKFDYKKEIDLFKHGFKLTFAIGPVPVMIQFDFRLFAGAIFRMDGYAQVTYGIKENASFEVGAEYKSGKFSPVFDKKKTSKRMGPELYLCINAYAEAYLKPELAILLYGVAGPRFSVEPYLAFELLGDGKPKCHKCKLGDMNCKPKKKALLNDADDSDDESNDEADADTEVADQIAMHASSLQILGVATADAIEEQDSDIADAIDYVSESESESEDEDEGDNDESNIDSEGDFESDFDFDRKDALKFKKPKLSRRMRQKMAKNKKKRAEFSQKLNRSAAGKAFKKMVGQVKKQKHLLGKYANKGINMVSKKLEGTKWGPVFDKAVSLARKFCPKGKCNFKKAVDAMIRELKKKYAEMKSQVFKLNWKKIAKDAVAAALKTMASGGSWKDALKAAAEVAKKQSINVLIPGLSGKSFMEILAMGKEYAKKFGRSPQAIKSMVEQTMAKLKGDVKELHAIPPKEWKKVVGQAAASAAAAGASGASIEEILQTTVKSAAKQTADLKKTTWGHDSYWEIKVGLRAFVAVEVSLFGKFNLAEWEKQLFDTALVLFNGCQFLGMRCNPSGVVDHTKPKKDAAGKAQSPSKAAATGASSLAAGAKAEAKAMATAELKKQMASVKFPSGMPSASSSPLKSLPAVPQSKPTSQTVSVAALFAQAGSGSSSESKGPIRCHDRAREIAAKMWKAHQAGDASWWESVKYAGENKHCCNHKVCRCPGGLTLDNLESWARVRKELKAVEEKAMAPAVAAMEKAKAVESVAERTRVMCQKIKAMGAKSKLVPGYDSFKEACAETEKVGRKLGSMTCDASSKLKAFAKAAERKAEDGMEGDAGKHIREAKYYANPEKLGCTCEYAKKCGSTEAIVSAGRSLVKKLLVKGYGKAATVQPQAQSTSVASDTHKLLAETVRKQAAMISTLAMKVDGLNRRMAELKELLMKKQKQKQ